MAVAAVDDERRYPRRPRQHGRDAASRPAVEEALAGGADAKAAAEKADEGTDPPSDVAGSSDYRRHLARVLTKRALEQTLAGR